MPSFGKQGFNDFPDMFRIVFSLHRHAFPVHVNPLCCSKFTTTRCLHPKTPRKCFFFMFLPTKNLASPGSFDVGSRAAAQDHRQVSLHDRSTGHDLPLATRQREASVETELPRLEVSSPPKKMWKTTMATMWENPKSIPNPSEKRCGKE